MAAARIGGDEFLIAGRSPGDQGSLLGFAERLHQAVGGSLLPTDAGPLPLHCSIGISLSDAADDVQSLVAKADRALYRDKQRRRRHRATSGVARP